MRGKQTLTPRRVASIEVPVQQGQRHQAAWVVLRQILRLGEFGLAQAHQGGPRGTRDHASLELGNPLPGRHGIALGEREECPTVGGPEVILFQLLRSICTLGRRTRRGNG